MHCTSTKFGVDGSSLFPFSARIHTQTDTHRHTDATAHTTHGLVTAGVAICCVLKTQFRKLW